MTRERMQQCYSGGGGESIKSPSSTTSLLLLFNLPRVARFPQTDRRHWYGLVLGFAHS
jgi:hypothetical protein